MADSGKSKGRKALDSLRMKFSAGDVSPLKAGDIQPGRTDQKRLSEATRIVDSLGSLGKNSGRSVIKNCFLSKGRDAAVQLGIDLIEVVEHRKGTPELNSFKGEVTETVLHCCLRDCQEWYSPSIATHGLCITSVSGKLTAEIDVLFLTPQKLYLFECKSFSGPKVLSDKGSFKGKFSEADIYNQSMGHLALLYDYIGGFLDTRWQKQINPVQLVLFDGGLGPCTDTRPESWKKVLPYVSIRDVASWCDTEFSRLFYSQIPSVWNVDKVADVIQKFQTSNDQNIESHLKRLEDKRGLKYE